ncbi:FAD-dependent oxidoreductase [Streptacidiphilus sp. ASG 303]|uniref:NAD(P)/FAD-dependent oxidoreductase n=1 Tax=Streptacidiphilus sp. ASG 303 TaxID=2896847 RepID=UPI001E5E31C5|nr:FAD-dependent oxidoreductase [Streptacidiphilus sp. ASG 303]MCD0482640.1 FAD-dependent oxidoreductase [Streptacidiphilus sp. ASG 303]
MVDTNGTFVIVGAGLAGAKAAETLRAEGFTGRVILLGDEREEPYERPGLSKGFLTGAEERDALRVHEPAWYAAHEVELHLGQPATALDRAAKEVRLGDGSALRYDRLLLATGSSPRPLQVPGADLAGVHVLRRLPHAERLRSVLRTLGRENGQLLVVGAGWIGLEVAAAARGYGAEVTVVEPQPTPLHGVLGPELGAFFADLHREHGVSFQLGASVTEVVGQDGMVLAALTDTGEELPAHAVVVGIGATPDTALAEAAGLDVAPRGEGGGVAVDASLRTSDPDVFAAGDVASAWHPVLGRRLRVEHWANALNGGPAAARAMLGQEVSYDRIPYFFSDQYELGMEYSGFAAPGEYAQVVVRGDAGKREFLAFWLDAEDRVLAGMNANVWDVAESVQRLVRSRRPVDPERLADPAVPLDAVLG